MPMPQSVGGRKGPGHDGVDRSVSAVQGSSWVEIQDSDGNLLFTLEGITDPTGFTFTI